MRLTTLLAAALGAACALVLVLAYENRQLQARQDALYARALQPVVGTWLPQSTQVGLDGRSVHLGAGERAQVLYFFNTGCPFCEASAGSIRALSATLRDGAWTGVDLVGVGSGADLAGYRARKGFAFPVVAQSRKLAHLFGVRQVPLLVAVDDDGRVLYSHAGAIADQDELGALLAVLRATERRAAAHHQEKPG